MLWKLFLCYCFYGDEFCHTFSLIYVNVSKFRPVSEPDDLSVQGSTLDQHVTILIVTKIDNWFNYPGFIGFD